MSKLVRSIADGVGVKKPHRAKPKRKHKRGGTAAPAPVRMLPAARRATAPVFAIRFDKIADVMPGWLSRRGSGGAVAGAYAADEREALALLLLPFFLLAFAIGISQSIRPGHRASDFISVPYEAVDAARHRVRLPPAEAGHLAEPARTEVEAATLASPTTVGASRPAGSVQVAVPAAEATAPAATTGTDVARVTATPATDATVTRVAAMAPTEIAPAGRAIDAPAEAVTAPAQPLAVAGSPASPSERLAALAAPPATAVPPSLVPPAGPALPPELAILARPEAPTAGPNICSLSDVAKPASGGMDDAGLARDPMAFGMRLAEAARGQVDDLVIYNDAYRRISYPLGDVPAMFGVCTDVVIRAYRSLGVDLQALVHTARAGSGDTNIDHRRVETLRRYFTARGASLPVTDFPEDYRAGDIVTYYRPQNRHSRSHIAIVSDIAGPSGRPMIVHNRGWGVQLEDGLFVDQITGHYRFAATPASTPPAALRAEGSAGRSLPVQAAQSEQDGPGGVTLCPVSARGGLRSRQCSRKPGRHPRQAVSGAHTRTQ